MTRSLMTPCAVLCLAVTTLSCTGPEPPPPPFPTAEIRLRDWGLADHGQIRVGRLSEVPSEGRVDVHALWTAQDLDNPPTTTTAAPDHEGACYVIDDQRMRTGGANALGGHWGVFQRAPSSADLEVVETEDGTRVLALHATRDGEGFCGAWMQLYDAQAAERAYVDATAFATLELWVRAPANPGGVILRLADERLDRAEDSLPVGSLDRLTDRQLSAPGWRRVTVSLDRLPPGLDRSRLASLALEHVAPGEHHLEVGTVGLCTSAGALETPGPRLSVDSGSERPTRLAMWLWDTGELLSSRRQRRRLEEFVVANGITDIMLQVPTDEGSTGELTARQRRRSALRVLIGALSSSGARVHALDGHPTFALPERHQDVLRVIDSVAAFNAEGQPEERFVGVHYDIEPYLLQGFGSSRRAQILQDYLTVVAALADRARGHGLEAAVDIPFWFDSRDEDTRRDMAVDFEGRREIASRHVIDLVDTVYIMDYRTTASGGDGLLAHASGELEYASAGDTKVFVGLETHPLPDERYVRFSGEPLAEPPRDLAPDVRLVVSVASGGSAVFHLVEAGRLDAFPSLVEVPEGADVLYWEVERVTDILASRITFAGSSPEALAGVMASASSDLESYSAFSGFAIHHYGSWKALISPRR